MADGDGDGVLGTLASQVARKPAPRGFVVQILANCAAWFESAHAAMVQEKWKLKAA